MRCQWGFENGLVNSIKECGGLNTHVYFSFLGADLSISESMDFVCLFACLFSY